MSSFATFCAIRRVVLVRHRKSNGRLGRMLCGFIHDVCADHFHYFRRLDERLTISSSAGLFAVDRDRD